MKADELLSTSEAAAILGMTRWRLTQIIHGGKIPARRVGRNWVIDRRELEAAAPLLSRKQSGRRKAR